jgi:hypothetical protein
MKYTVEVEGKEIEVDGIEFGTTSGSAEGNINLFITVFDRDEDIYTNESKRDMWINWLDKCLGDKHNPAERIKPVVAKIWGGPNDSVCYRTIRIHDACMDSFNEMSSGMDCSYTVTITRAARKAREDLVQVQAS